MAALLSLALRRRIERLGFRAPGLVQRRSRALELRQHARALRDEVLERACRSYWEEQFLWLDFARTAKPAEDCGDRVALAFEFALANGNVLGAVVAAAQFAPAVDAPRDLKGGRVLADQPELLLERADRGLHVLLLRGQTNRLRLQLGERLAPAVWRRRQIGERREPRFRIAERGEMRQAREQPLNRFRSRPAFAERPCCGLISRLRLVAPAHQFGIGRGQRVGLLALLFQRLQLALLFRQFAALGARPEKPIGLLTKAVEPAAHFGEARAGRKQELAEIAAALQDRLSSLLQALVVEGEHHPERGAVDARELRLDERLIERTVVRIDEAVLVALEARDFVRAARKLEPRADPHRAIGVPVRSHFRRAVGRLLLDAKQEIEDRRRDGRFSRFVEAVDDVEVRAIRRRRAEVELIVGEPAVADEIEPRDPHETWPLSAARR